MGSVLLCFIFEVRGLCMAPRSRLINPVSAGVVAISQEDQYAQPDQARDHEELRQTGGVSHTHEDPRNKRSFEYRDNERNDDIQLTKVDVRNQCCDEC